MAPDQSSYTARLRVRSRWIEVAVRVASLTVDGDGRAEVDAILWNMTNELKAIGDRAQERRGQAPDVSVAVNTRIAEGGATGEEPTSAQ